MWTSHFTNSKVDFNKRQSNEEAHTLVGVATLLASLTNCIIPRCIKQLIIYECYKYIFFQKINLVFFFDKFSINVVI